MRAPPAALAPFSSAHALPYYAAWTAAEPLVAFSGDTTLPGLLACDAALRARVLIMELTSLDAGLPPDKCTARGHVHLEDLVARWAEVQWGRAARCALRAARVCRLSPLLVGPWCICSR
jgi:hypothetical protein